MPAPADPSPPAAWSHRLHPEPDGTCRVEVVDEDGAVVPVARKVTPAQAERLVARIRAEAEAEGKPVGAVVRDPYFMAATVITVKRVPDPGVAPDSRAGSDAGADR